jgi:hypothetical protein
MAAAIGRWRGMLGVCVSVLTVLMTMSDSAVASQADYNRAYALGLQAYTYGLPLLETNKTFLAMTSINVSNGSGFGPVNQFNSVRKLNNPNSKAVVAPGASSLSSIAWLDLRRGPQVLHVPRVRNHYFVLALVDPYTEDIINLGTVHRTKPGYYVIAGPGQHNTAIPAGSHRIDVDYTRIWIIGSTQLKGKSDLANVHRIQDGYTLTPLSRYGTNYHPKRPARPRTKVKNYQLPSGLRFFDVLGELLKRFPPPAADRPELRKLAAVGIGPGLKPSRKAGLNADTLRGLRAALAAGPAQIQTDARAQFVAGAAKHDGYFLGGFGRYGTNYQLRAVIAQVGLGAVSSDQTIFALALTDHSLAPLSGSANYVMHLPSLPPANEGWSVTVYDLHGFLVPNPINRYQLNNTSALARNPDGSIDIYLQANPPSNLSQAENWLPTPTGAGFEVIWRLIAPKPDQINGILDGSGWQPPAITAAP